MGFLKINGIELPSPLRGVTVTVVTNVETDQNSNGEIVGQRVGRDKYKIDGLEWPWLTSDEWAKMLSLLSNYFVYVTFVDPITNAEKTIRMYPSDRKATPHRVDGSGKPTHFTDCTFNLIDTGADE